MNMHTKTEAMGSTAIVTRATIEEIVGFRDRALALYEQAYGALEAAEAAVAAARDMAGRASPGINGYNYSHEEEIKRFDQAIRLPEREEYLRTARKLIDINVWSYVIERTDLERLMDHEAKKKLRDQMKYIPERAKNRTEIITEDEAGKGLPPVTVENIYATLDEFAKQSGMIFRRGIANAFSKLDRRFKSHDGFKIGSRIILTRAFNDWGSLNWGYVQDTLIDVERVFAVVDGETEASFTSALRALDYSRRGHHGPRQSEVETEYFKIRGFKNGNAHLWFQRDDLVEKVNKLLAEYYGEVIADGQTAEEDPFEKVKTTPARYYGFFPTPEDLARRVVEKVHTYREKGQAPLRILEPSAGTGNLSSLLARKHESYTQENYQSPRIPYTYRASVDCIELQPHLAVGLEAAGIYNRVYCMDFLKMSPEVTGLYDRIVMNPPFDRERDIDHVVHAMKFLKPDGQLIAIMSAGTEFRETKKAIAFRALVEAKHGDFCELPAGSFAEVGTNVNTCAVAINNDGRRPSWGWRI